MQPLWKTVQKCLKKLKIELPYDPAIPFLGIYSDKSIISKNTFTPVFIAALFTIAKTQKQTKCSPTDEWIKKMCTHTHTHEYYSAMKKNEIMPAAATWVVLEIIILSAVRKRNTIHCQFYVGSKTQMNISTKQQQT